MLAVILLTLGCSGGSDSNPVSSDISHTPLQSAEINQPSSTFVWGFYDVAINTETQEWSVVPNRTVAGTLNIIPFINLKPAYFTLTILDIDYDAMWNDVDVNFNITHPLGNLSMYSLYDVRGVMFTDGSKTMDYGNGLVYGRKNVDQYIFNDPIPNDFPDDYTGGAPDGYTRWFNPTEFTVEGLLGYTPGNFSTPDLATATLNPYKYFADGLGPYDDAFEFLADNSHNGIFSGTDAKSRNYYIRFPLTKWVKFNYGILADWEGEDPVLHHPSNAEEPVVAGVSAGDGVYYAGPSNNGGYLTLDLNIIDWDASVNESGYVDDYTIKIDSTVLSNTYTFDSYDMVPVASGDNWHTYHVNILADDVKGTTNQEFWVIAESNGNTYANIFGIPNSVEDEILAAFFRYDLSVSSTPDNWPPEIIAIGDDTPYSPYKNPVDHYDTAITYSVLFYDPDPGDTHEITWFIVKEGLDILPWDQITMPVNWSLYPSAYYDIYCFVDDGTVEVRSDPFYILKNTEPVVDGVYGDDYPLAIVPSSYYVSVTDPDIFSDITCKWTLTDMVSGTPVSGYNQVSLGPDDEFVVDWDAIGAGDNHDYKIDCNVYDEITSVSADTLFLTTTYDIFYANFENGEEGMFVQWEQYPTYPNRRWRHEAIDGIWRESLGGVGTYSAGARSRLSTPTFSVPSGISEVRLAVRQHSGTMETGDRCYLQYATAATNFATLTYWSTLIHGSYDFSVVETWTLPASMIGKTNAAIGFYFSADTDYSYIGIGWDLREVRVYVVP